MLVYLIIALFATVIGSLAGLGGGVIIKPLLQSVSTLDVVSINVISSITVFSMATSTLYKRTKKDKSLFKPVYLYLIIGSIIGGFIGNKLFTYILVAINNQNIVAFMQTLILTTVLIVVVFKNSYIDKLPTYNTKKSMFIIGLMLSILSTFLGIGGGPINIPIFLGLLGVPLLNATYLSILVIFFAQLSNIIIYFASGVLESVVLAPLIVMVPTSIIGGLIGSKLSSVFEEETISKLFNTVIICLIILNMYNLVIFIG